MPMLLWCHIFFKSIIDDSGCVVSSVGPSAPTLLSCHTSTGNLVSRPEPPAPSLSSPSLCQCPRGPCASKRRISSPLTSMPKVGPPMRLFRHRKGQRYRAKAPDWEHGRIKTRPTYDSPSIIVAIATLLGDRKHSLDTALS